LNGRRVRNVVEAGVAHDQAIEKSDLTIAGWRPAGNAQVQILYSLQTAGGPSTPWPSTALAARGPDGHWQAGTQYACGIQGVASGGCYTPTGERETGLTPLTVAAVPVSP
jgi:hypothetical protein